MNNSYYLKNNNNYLLILINYFIKYYGLNSRQGQMIRQSRHIQPAPRTIYLLFLTQFVVRVCVGTFFAEFAECRHFIPLFSHEIVSTALIDTSMVVKRRFYREFAVMFSRNDAYSVHLRRGYKEQQWAPGWHRYMPTCSWLI